MKFIILFMATACLGCPPQPIPTKLDAGAPIGVLDMSTPAFGMDNCPAIPNITFEDVCDGMFTESGLACVNCHEISACFDEHDVIYCVSKGGCLADPACVFVHDGEDGSPGSKRKLRRPAKKIQPKIGARR